MDCFAEPAIRRRFAPTGWLASIVSADRIVFNIKGNDYRLVVAVDFEKSIEWIKWIGTHRDYKDRREGGSIWWRVR